MHFQTTTSVAFGILAFSTPALAFFRLPCSQPLLTARADPIVNPGVVSGHVHTIMGGNGFGFDMTYEDTQKSTCSSCAVTKDLSNYWVPSLYYKGEDGTFQSVKQAGGALIYYLQRTDPKDPLPSEGLLAFPEGFRMTAGNPFLRNYTDTLQQRAINYACLGANIAETNGFPNVNCPQNLRAQVFFPSCWNGVDLDTPDHQSHMAYPSNYNSGHCPDSHPHRFVSIFYEVRWETEAFADMWYGDSQPFVWSMGDPTGYGFHGDFLNGWDVPTLQNAVTNCNADSGVIQDCPVFDNLYFTHDENDGCRLPTEVDEQVFGKLDALPGCNLIQSGPELATPHSGCGAVNVIGAAENPFVDLTQTKGFKYLGCGTDFAYGADRTLTGSSATLSDLTVESCVEHCEAAGFSIAGMEYANQCYCGNSLTAGRDPLPEEGACTMPCAGDSSEYCGGYAWISLYQKCTSGEDCENISFILNPKTGAQPADGVSTVPAHTTTMAAGAATTMSTSSTVTLTGGSQEGISTSTESSTQSGMMMSSSSSSSASTSTTTQAPNPPGITVTHPEPSSTSVKTVFSPSSSPSLPAPNPTTTNACSAITVVTETITITLPPVSITITLPIGGVSTSTGTTSASFSSRSSTSTSTSIRSSPTSPFSIPIPFGGSWNNTISSTMPTGTATGMNMMPTATGTGMYGAESGTSHRRRRHNDWHVRRHLQQRVRGG